MCGDGRCQLNRQGVPHESHDIIEDRPVQDQCNDPRCAMNRMGISHESHESGWLWNRTGEPASGGKSAGEPEAATGSLGRTKQRPEPGSRQSRPAAGGHTSAWSRSVTGPPASERNSVGKAEAASGSGGQTEKKPESGSGPSRPAAGGAMHGEQGPSETDDAFRNLAEGIGREMQSEKPTQEDEAFHSPPSEPRRKASQESRREAPQPDTRTPEHRILDSKDPHDIFGISKDASLSDVKARYRELARKHNPSTGIIFKSPEEKERASRIMARINQGYAQLKRMHGGNAK